MDKKTTSDNCISFRNDERFETGKNIYVAEGVIAYNALYVDKMHFHDFFELEFILDGYAKQNLNGKSYILERGVIYLLNTNDMHRYCFARGESVHYISVQFKNDFLSKETLACINACKKTIIAKVRKNYDFYVALLRKLKGVYSGADIISVNLMRSLLETVCLSLLGEADTQPDRFEENRINEIIVYIRNNYRKHITIQNLAEKFNLSPNYLGQLFFKETHMTVLQFVKRNRLLMAANLIQNTNLNFNSIAYEVGFSSPYVFCREFKNFYHLSPTEYRNARK